MTRDLRRDGGETARQRAVMDRPAPPRRRERVMNARMELAEPDLGPAPTTEEKGRTLKIELRDAGLRSESDPTTVDD